MKLEDKIYMTISLVGNKFFDKIQHSFMLTFEETLVIQEIKQHDQLQLKRIGTQSNFTSIRKKTRNPLFSYPFNIILEVLGRAIRQLKETKGIQLGKKEIEAYFYR